MLTQHAVINIVHNFAKEIETEGIHLHKVILYGSFAKETQNEWSDIDVALVADEFTGLGFVDKALFSKTGIKKEYARIEPKTFSSKYFNENDPFVYEIQRTGVEIT